MLRIITDSKIKHGPFSHSTTSMGRSFIRNLIDTLKRLAHKGREILDSTDKLHNASLSWSTERHLSTATNTRQDPEKRIVQSIAVRLLSFPHLC
jgi:hypothetical protein